MENKLEIAVVPVAGLGTRMLPATKSIPKEMLPIVDRPVIQYVVEEIYYADLRKLFLLLIQAKMLLENILIRVQNLRKP